MKKSIQAFLTALLLTLSGAACANDYTSLAEELTLDRTELRSMRIAVIPFAYADGRVRDGQIISQRLETELSRMGLRVVEADLPKVLKEQRRQASGGFAPGTIQHWGELLGAEAIITGTLVETSSGKIEVNARLLMTETAEMLGAANATLKKNWHGGDEAAVSYRAYYKQPSRNSYFELFLGGGAPDLSLKFQNDGSRPIYINDLGLWSSAGNIGPLKEVQWKKLKTGGVGPVAMRFTGYNADKVVGGAVELGWEKRFIKAQKCMFTLNDSRPLNFTFATADYLTVTSLYLVGDLMVRLTKDFPIEPYLGAGLGISLNTLKMPHVRGFTKTAYFSAPTNDFGVGFVLSVPVGVRLKIADTIHLVGELKYQSNTLLFDRGIPGESDSLKISGMYFNVGTGFSF